ncbi:MFS transporter [Skermanella stibiiresistens]|nr:MFS transporter [Skermanella stibiiresistens]
MTTDPIPAATDPVATRPARSPSLALPVAALAGVQALVSCSLFAVPTMAPVVALDVGVDPATLVGVYMAVIFGLGIVSSPVGGDLVLRLGALRVAQICLLGCGVGLGLAATGIWWMFIPAALAIGCAFAPETPASSHLLMRISPPHRRGLVFSLKQTGNQIGGVAGALALPALIPLIGWRGGLLVVGCLCVVAAILLGSLRAVWETPVERQTGTILVRYRRSMALVRADARLRALALASGGYTVMQISLNAFLVSYCVVELGMGLAMAGATLAVAQIGGLIGRVFWGAVGDRITHKRRVLGLLGFAMAVAAVLTVGVTWTFWPLTVLSFLFGLTASGWNGLFLAEVARLAPEGRVGEATGGVLIATFVGLVAGPPVFGLLVQLSGSYAPGFMVAAAFCVAGGVLLMRR